MNFRSMQSEAAERRQKVAHGVSRGSDAMLMSSPGGAKVSVAPLGLPISFPFVPTDHAVGYSLSRLPTLVKRPFGEI
jgi:hypothetical protein